MKKTFSFFFFITVFLTVNCFAQIKTFTLEDAYSKRLFTPKSLKQLQWIPGSDNYTYVDLKMLIKGNVVNEQRDTLLNLAELNKKLDLLKEAPLTAFPVITWTDVSTFYFQGNNKIFSYHIKDKSVLQENTVNEKAENIDVMDKTLNAAYTIKNNLFISMKGKEYAITSDTNKNIVNGKTVHREEFGIVKGTFWSPKGNYLAFYRMDQTMVTDYPLVHIDKVSNRIAEEEDIKYPMAGMKSHHVTVGVYNPLNTKENIFKNRRTGRTIPDKHHMESR